MKNIIILLIVCLIGYKAYNHYEEKNGASRAAPAKLWSPGDAASVATSFKCDGRTHCSQMTSCEEATFFLKNCPGTKMDGNNDGVPCEQQWCR